MADTTKIREKMKVMCSKNCPIGTVDHVEGNSIKLQPDPAAGNQPHWIPVDWVTKVDESVHLSKTDEDVKKQWHTTAPKAATTTGAATGAATSKGK